MVTTTTVTTTGDGTAQFLESAYAVAAGGSTTIALESVADEYAVKALITLAAVCLRELAIDLSDRFPDPAAALDAARLGVAERLEHCKSYDIVVDIKNCLRQEVIREVIRDVPKSRTVREVVRDDQGHIVALVEQQ